MDLIADILLVSGALGAGFYCFVLSRRLSKFNDLEGGVGGAVAVLSAQVDDLTKALAQAQGSANSETERLKELTDRADTTAKQLELMMASMHDLPEMRQTAPPPRAETTTSVEPEKTEPVFSRSARRSA